MHLRYVLACKIRENRAMWGGKAGKIGKNFGTTVVFSVFLQKTAL